MKESGAYRVYFIWLTGPLALAVFILVATAVYLEPVSGDLRNQYPALVYGEMAIRSSKPGADRSGLHRFARRACGLR